MSTNRPSIMNGAMREQADRVLFDRIAAEYAKKDVARSSSLAREYQLLSAIQVVLRTRSSLGTLVDIGCGVGAPAHYLAGAYTRYIGIDQSREMIEAARAFNDGNHAAEFLTCNVKSRELPTDVADVILSVGALHHMTDLDDVMGSLVRVAKPGAFLVVIEPQNGNPAVQTMRWVREKVDNGYSRDQIHFSADDLVHLFQRHDIRVIEVSFQGFLVPPFAQVIMRPQIIFTPLSRASCAIDRWLNAHLPVALRRLGFNVVVTGRFAA